jgi:hypothetical protein
MNHKAAAFVALLAAALAVIPFGAADSSGDGGVMRGEGAGEGFSMEYTSSPVPYIDLHFEKAQSTLFMILLSGPDDYLEMGAFPMDREITILLQDDERTPHHLVAGDYTVLITGTQGEQLGDCVMRVYPANIVTFDPNGGSGTMDRQFVEKGGTYTLPDCGFDAPQGKTFDSWMHGASEYRPGDSIALSGDTEIKATWKESSDDGFPTILVAGIAAVIAVLALAIILLGRRKI